MNMIPQHRLDGKMIELIAMAIAQCDFRVTISKYITSQNWPWVITVGENRWQRHMVVLEISEDYSDATFYILTPEQSDKSGYDINTGDIERRISLSELIADKYRSVRNFLAPKSLVVA